MIKKKLLNIIFNKNKYHIDINEYFIDLHAFKKANLNILIVSNDEYDHYVSYFKRKNCLIYKDIYTTSIIFNINFIKSIIRNKQINCILNNV